MNNRYYKQSDPTTPLYLSNGQKLVFPHVDYQFGYIATKDKFLIGELNAAINKGIGGVTVSTKAEYSEYLKKKSLGVTPQRRWRDEIIAETALDPSQSPYKNPAPVAEEAESGNKVKAEEPTPKKRVGKFKKKSK